MHAPPPIAAPFHAAMVIWSMSCSAWMTRSPMRVRRRRNTIGTRYSVAGVGQIRPRREVFAGAGEDDRARFGVVAEGQRSLLDLREVRVVQRVGALRAIEGDDGNRPAVFDRKMLIAHLLALSRGDVCGIRRRVVSLHRHRLKRTHRAACRRLRSSNVRGYTCALSSKGPPRVELRRAESRLRVASPMVARFVDGGERRSRELRRQQLQQQRRQWGNRQTDHVGIPAPREHAAGQPDTAGGARRRDVDSGVVRAGDAAAATGAAGNYAINAQYLDPAGNDGDADQQGTGHHQHR